MTIHKEGIRSILISAVIIAIVNLASFYFISYDLPWLSWLIFAVTMVLWFFIISFFRVPVRNIVAGEDLVICPADGKVVVIEEAFDEEYFNEKRLQISIFMSPANVHQNLNPVSGEIVYNKYHPGKFLVAWHPKSSTENERHTSVIRNDKGDILMKQIAGAVARRIVNYLQVGQVVRQSTEFGFIKFGSRVDLLLPVDAKVNVQMGQVVKGGITVIATLK
jgi:phosphatidylserine decarboxylase